MKNKNKNLPVNITFYINLQILNFTSFKQAALKIAHTSPRRGEQPIMEGVSPPAETCQKEPSPLAGICQKEPSLLADCKKIFKSTRRVF